MESARAELTGTPTPDRLIEAVHSQLRSALDVVIHLGRGRDGRRRVHEIGVVRPGAQGSVDVVPGVRLGADGAIRPGPAIEELSRLVEP